MDTESLLLLQDLTEKQREYVIIKSNDLKQSSTAYICWFVAGVHYFYLNRPFMNILYWFTLGIVGIWAVIDLFRIPGLVRKANREKIRTYIAEAKALYPAP